MAELSIARRFCGPPGVVNGGYVAGCVAAVIDGTAEVTLRAPTPLETALVLQQEASGVSLRTREGALLAEGSSVAKLDLPLPAPASFADAERASPRYVGFHDHPYPSCFVCGPERPAELGPGLGLFPGAVDGRQLVAA